MPTLTDYALELNHYVRIETIGVPATGSNETLSLYVFEQVPENNWPVGATQRFISGLRLEKGFSQSTDPLGGIANVSGIDFEVQDFRDAVSGTTNYFWALILATERWDADPANFPHTFLTGGAGGVGTTFDRDDATINVQSTAGFPAAPSSFWIGQPGNQECVRYTGTTATTFTGLGRGRHPAVATSFARTHRVGLNDDGAALAPVLVTTRPQSFFGLRFAVYAVARRRDGTWEPEGSAVRRYTGVIRHLDYVPGRNSFRFRCDSLLSQLDREVFAPQRQYRSRLYGCHLGPRAIDRQFTVLGRTYTLSSAWYQDHMDLGDAINETISVYYQSSGGTYGTMPRLVWEPEVVDEVAEDRWGWYGGRVEMSPGIAAALGWRQTSVANPDPVYAVADGPPAETSLLWPAALEDQFVLRVASRDGASVGDSLLIGGLYSARVVATGVQNGVDTITARSGWIGGAFPYVDDARGVSIAVDESGESLMAESGSYRHQGTDVVEEVFPVGLSPGNLARTVRQLLLSTGTLGYNSADDTLVDGYGVGIANADVDVTSINSVLADVDPLAFLFLLRTATPLRAILDDIAKVLGLSWVMDAGQIVLRRLSSLALARSAVADIADNDLADEDSVPAYSISPELFFNGVQIKWAWDAVTEEFKHLPLVVQRAQASGMENRLREIESKGLWGRADTIVANELESLLGWLAVFDRPQARVRLNLSARWANRIAPADVVTVSLSELHNRRAGGYGTSLLIAIVLAVDESWRGEVGAELLLLNEQRQTPLAPSALLDYARGDGGWDAANNRLYLRDNEFTDAPDLDVNWFLAADRILVCQDDANDPAAPLLWRVTVQSVTGGAGGYVTLTGALPPPAFVAANRYFVTFDTYDVTAAGRRDDGTWVADDADSRIGATNDWYPYT